MKALLLLSGGIDSPVASFLLKNKTEIIAIHFSFFPLKFSEEPKIRKLCQKLEIKTLLFIPFGDVIKKLIIKINPKYRCLLCRRFMFRIAEKLAKKYNCKYLITGENLNQVASQTLTNMLNAQEVVRIPILRPLLCFDKQEIIDLAKKIGTYEISISSPGCCGAVPKNPITESRLDIIKKEESKIEIEELTKKTILNLKEIKC